MFRMTDIRRDDRQRRVDSRIESTTLLQEQGRQVPPPARLRQVLILDTVALVIQYTLSVLLQTMTHLRQAGEASPVTEPRKSRYAFVHFSLDIVPARPRLC